MNAFGSLAQFIFGVSFREIEECVVTIVEASCVNPHVSVSFVSSFVEIKQQEDIESTRV